jgi:CubicO group peptidase (beta-lactamase class C family)
VLPQRPKSRPMTKPIRLSTALLLAILANGVPAAPVHANADTLIAQIEAPQIAGKNEFDALTLQELMARLHIPGFSLAVVKDFKIHWAKAYGVADAETRRPLDTDTRFQSASIAKPVTAFAALRLAQEHRLNLDADINTVIKTWQAPSSGITPRSLFSHTSGADDGFGFPGYEPNTPLPTVVQVLNGQAPSNVGKVTFARAPYESFKYSGGGVLIMQLAMTELTGLPFAQFMHTTVLEPLQMTRSGFDQPQSPADSPNTALAHDKDGRRLGPPWRIHPELATSGLWTTPRDLANFLIEIQLALRGPKGTLLDQQFAQQMITPAGVGKYGVGLAIGQRGEGWYFTHSGSNLGYRAWMIGHVRKGYGLIMMANSENGMALLNQVGDRVERAYHWDSLATQ